jgi:hypothetical protein
LLDNTASARHRIDSAKTLNDFAANGPAGVPASDRFQITIVMNSDVLHFDKSIEINPNDVPFNNSNILLEESAFTTIATKKKEGSDD